MANGKMQFENVAREWRCKWKDDGGGSAACKGLGTKAPAPPGTAKNGPGLLRASASLICAHAHT